MSLFLRRGKCLDLTTRTDARALSEKSCLRRAGRVISIAAYRQTRADAHWIWDERDPTLRALCWLHEFRSTYIHYPPVQLTLEVSQIINIVRIAVEVIASEIDKDDWKRRPLITFDNVTPLLDCIRRRFQQT
jgi:hypothetical protein